MKVWMGWQYSEMEAYRTYINYCRCKNIRFCLVVLKDCHTVRVGYLILFTFLLSTDSVNNEKINKGPENQINEWTRVKQMKYPQFALFASGRECLLEYRLEQCSTCVARCLINLSYDPLQYSSIHCLLITCWKLIKPFLY